MSEEESTSTTTENAESASKRERRLTKDLATSPGKVIITVVGGTKGPMTFDPDILPTEIQKQLPAFAISHKLGDSASGLSGIDAEEAIIKVWEGMVAGDWTVRAPAAPKISLRDIAQNYANLSDEEQEAAKKLMADLGIQLPGVTA